MQDHRQQEGQSEGPLQQMRGNVLGVIAICQMFSAPLYIVTRRFGTWGERFCGFHMGAGLLALPVIGAFSTPQDHPEQLAPLMWLWCAMWGLLLVHRIAGIWRRSRGEVVHSLYDGAVWWPTRNEVRAKRNEHGLILLLGLGCLVFSQPLGAWVIGAAVCGCISTEYQHQARQAQLRAIRDSQREGAWLHANYRKEGY